MPTVFFYKSKKKVEKLENSYPDQNGPKDPSSSNIILKLGIGWHIDQR